MFLEVYCRLNAVEGVAVVRDIQLESLECPWENTPLEHGGDPSCEEVPCNEGGALEDGGMVDHCVEEEDGALNENHDSSLEEDASFRRVMERVFYDD